MSHKQNTKIPNFGKTRQQKQSVHNNPASCRITPFTTRYPEETLLGIPVHFLTLARTLQT